MLTVLRFVLTSKNYIRTVTAIKPEWLFELAPVYFDINSFKKGDVRISLERVQAKMEKAREIAEKRARAQNGKLNGKRY